MNMATTHGGKDVTNLIRGNWPTGEQHARRDSRQASAKSDSSTTGITGLSAYEMIDSKELARRWCLPESWIRDQVRARAAADPLPHARFGKYVRFLWGSEELEAWLRRRIIGGNNSKVERALGKETIQ